MASYGVEPENIAVAGAGVAMSFPVNDSSSSSSPAKLPRRLRHRLSECRTTSTTAAQDIEAKLNGAHLRRQQFYESLSSKARPRQRSPQHLCDFGQRLEAKLNAAERKRLSVLTNKQHRAARSVQLLNVVNSAHAIAQREMERLKTKDLVEGRLQKARRVRAELLRQRKNTSSPFASAWFMSEDAENLARKLARSWKEFVKTRGTTYSLTKAFKRLNISTKAVKSTPFEQLALLMGSNSTLKAVKSLLDRLELHLKVQKGTKKNPSEIENIDHLLKHITPPNQSHNISFTNKTKGQKRTTHNNKSSSRYPVRIALCAYMIMAHPRSVLSRRVAHETTGLEEAAVKLVHEFELVVRVILEGGCLKSKGGGCNVGFRSQLGAFDNAWCSYLYCFTVWKVEDVKVLEDDLVGGACQLELSMMRTCKVTLEGNENYLTYDSAIRKQVYEDHALLKAKVKHLSGESGVNRLESALSDVRTKFFASKKIGNPSTF